jgi:methylglutaconyl-CoA hydratase
MTALNYPAHYQTLALTQSGAVATVTLNRPELRNAFNEIMIHELESAFIRLGQDSSVRVIVLAAVGPAFCAGGDLNWMKKMADYTPEENRADGLRLAIMLKTIYDCPQPVVARVQGDCYAGGMGLVSACDVVVAVPSAHFCLSEVKLGLIPATISPYVIKAMGEQAARRYFLTAERFSAVEAHRLGMVHELAAPDDLNAKIHALTTALVGNSPNAVIQAKRLVRDVVGRPINAELLAHTAQQIADIRSSDEGREGVASFLEKRSPAWRL